MLTRFINALFSKLETIISVLLYGLTAIAFLQLVSRYLLRFAPAGVDEFCRLAFVWVVSVGSALAFKKKAHMGITFLSNKLTGDRKDYLELAVYGILTVFMIAVLVAGIQMALMGLRQISTYLELSMGFFYACIPVGAALSILVFIEGLYTVFMNIKGGSK
ncbi:MAG: TRAP transporter small permease [Desulforhabdus sp.]|jgi:TRAP-type C4-dicarboxylate transport system permease small subunit|nr:TRAP transporter small permease [Desulforhabdus sp.]